MILSHWRFPALMVLLASVALPAKAADYVIDTEGMHASIHFRIPHLGYSWLMGRFNDFEGTFTWDEEQPEASTVNVSVAVDSVDSNHARRDKHLRDEEILHVAEYPEATFSSTDVEALDDGSLKISGDLTLRGVTREIVIDARHVGEGEDPWGGYRAGFTGTTTLELEEFGIPIDLGPASTEVQMRLDIEGVRQ